MICPRCGSPTRDIEGQPRSLVHELVDMFAVIEESTEGFAKERAQAAMAIVTAAIQSGNGASPSDTDIPRQVTDSELAIEAVLRDVMNTGRRLRAIREALRVQAKESVS